jgi:hypothetical protein
MDATSEKQPKKNSRVDRKNSNGISHYTVSNSGANSTLVEDEFQFNRHLQAQWDKAISEGIHVRDIGVTFKACMRTFQT